MTDNSEQKEPFNEITREELDPANKNISQLLKNKLESPKKNHTEDSNSTFVKNTEELNAGAEIFIEQSINHKVEVEVEPTDSTFVANKRSDIVDFTGETHGSISGRAYRYLHHAFHLDDTNFCTKTELTADYQGSILLSVSNDHYGSASNIIKTTAIKETSAKIAEENEEDGIQDGWLVKRHEKEAHAMIQLGAEGRVCGVDIDTTGYIQCAPLRAALYGKLSGQPRTWTKILPSIELKPNSHNFFETRNNTDIYDQILVTLAPGGGIRRLRVFGDVIPPAFPTDTMINLSSTTLGSQIVQKPSNVLRKDVPNLILDRADSSQDGWICPRNYHDDTPQYTVIKLALEGIIDRIVIDTTHFVGNSPKSVVLQGCSIIDDEGQITDPSLFNNAYWVDLIDTQDPTQQNIYPNMFQKFPCIYRGPLTHVRIRPIPDGGIQQIIFKGRVQQRDENNILIPRVESSNNKKRKHHSEQKNSNKEAILTRGSEKLKTASTSP